MNDRNREKLVELIQEAYNLCDRPACSNCDYLHDVDCCIDKLIADYLIANGMTIQTDINNEPLTYDELFELAYSEEYGSHIWVKELISPYDAMACVTDVYDGEVVAIWAIEQWYRGREYGETWIAYRYKPDYDNLGGMRMRLPEIKLPDKLCYGILICLGILMNIAIILVFLSVKKYS